jgi:hypothetical protein
MYSQGANMKTSLIIDDSLYAAAREESRDTGRSLSEVVTTWARLGREHAVKILNNPQRILPTVDLGSPSRIELASRQGWMETLEQ